MKILINIILIIIAAILQITLVPKLAILGVFPNLILLVMLSLIFITRTEEALWWAGLGGIILDLVSPARFGIYTFSFLVIFAAIFYLVHNIFREPSLLISILIFIVAGLMSNLIFLIMNFQIVPFLVSGLVSAFWGIIIYSLIKYYFKPKESIKI